MLLGNFKRGKDKKPRKRRGISDVAIGSTVGAIGLGGLSYSRVTPKKLLVRNAMKTDPLAERVFNSLSSKDKKHITDAIWDISQSSHSPKVLKNASKGIAKQRLGKVAGATVLGLGLGAAGGMAISKLRRHKEKQ